MRSCRMSSRRKWTPLWANPLRGGSYGDVTLINDSSRYKDNHKRRSSNIAVFSSATALNIKADIDLVKNRVMMLNYGTFTSMDENLRFTLPDLRHRWREDRSSSSGSHSIREVPATTDPSLHVEYSDHDLNQSVENLEAATALAQSEPSSFEASRPPYSSIAAATTSEASFDSEFAFDVEGNLVCRWGRPGEIWDEEAGAFIIYDTLNSNRTSIESDTAASSATTSSNHSVGHNNTSISASSMARTVIRERTRRYQWPNAQLNFWVIIMLAASCVTLGIFASFIRVQNQLHLPVPWFVLSTPLPIYLPFSG